jgi:hypothetical protein
VDSPEQNDQLCAASSPKARPHGGVRVLLNLLVISADVVHDTSECQRSALQRFRECSGMFNLQLPENLDRLSDGGQNFFKAP